MVFLDLVAAIGVFMGFFTSLDIMARVFRSDKNLYLSSSATSSSISSM